MGSVLASPFPAMGGSVWQTQASDTHIHKAGSFSLAGSLPLSS